ncbi:MAG: hypothetical protein ACI4Q9_01670 [Candidatus Methanomethylophilaceae archaeon]
MEFLNNTKNFGLMLTIIAIIDAIIGVLAVVNGGVSLDSVGAILSAAVMILAGIAIYMQTDGGIISFAFPEGSSSKFGALTGFIFATGISAILALNIPSIILGIIILIVGWVITNNHKGIADSIIWVLLIILFALLAIGSILAVFTADILIIVGGVCSAILYLIAFLYLLDPEVKSRLV